MRSHHLRPGAPIAWRDCEGFINEGRVVFLEADVTGESVSICVEARDGSRWAIHPLDIVDDVASAAAASAAAFA